MLNEWLLEVSATFILILTFLLTDNIAIILIAFALVLLAYGTSIGANPLIIIHKTLLGRNHPTHLRHMLIAQFTGAFLAYLTYHLLHKKEIIEKHPLDNF